MVTPPTEQLEIKEDTPIGSVVQRYLQKSQFSALERLLASYLIQAISASALDSIIYACRGAMTVDAKVCTELEIDIKKIHSVYRAALVLGSAYVDKEFGYAYISSYSLDYNADVAPWTITQRGMGYSIVSRNPTSSSDQKGAWLKIIEDIRLCPDREEAFKINCQNLSEQGLVHMKNDFVGYATPIAQDISNKLTQLINPGTWQDVLKTIVGSTGHE